MLLTVNKTNETISGVIGSEKYSLPYAQDVFDALTALEGEFSEADSLESAQAILAKATDAITEAKGAADTKMYGEYLQLNVKSQKYYLKSKGVVSSIPVPKVLVDKIVEAVDKGLSYLPFIKTWMWFLKNPKLNPRKADYFAKYITTVYVDQEEKAKLIEEGYSNDKATELATYNDVAISTNGLLSTYKYATIKYKKFDAEGKQVDRYEVVFDEETGKGTVTLPQNAEDYYLIPPIMGESGDAFFAGADLGHRIKVGAIHSLQDWGQVDCTDGVAGRPGLHLGGRRYIQGYGGNGRLLLNCFVNPMHIGAFTDNGDGAIRVKEYFVHAAEFAPNKSFYNESTYLSHTKAQWDEMLAEAVSASEKKIAQLKGMQDELAAL